MKTMMAVITNSEYLFQDFVLNHKHKNEDKAVLMTDRNIVVNLQHQYVRVTSVCDVVFKTWTGYHEVYDFRYQPELDNIKEAIKNRCYDTNNFSETRDSSQVY